jgi:hypothetical protein
VPFPGRPDVRAGDGHRLAVAIALAPPRSGAARHPRDGERRLAGLLREREAQQAAGIAQRQHLASFHVHRGNAAQPHVPARELPAAEEGERAEAPPRRIGFVERHRMHRHRRFARLRRPRRPIRRREGAEQKRGGEDRRDPGASVRSFPPPQHECPLTGPFRGDSTESLHKGSKTRSNNMLKKFALSGAAAAAALVAVPAAAEAQPNGRAHGYYNNSAHARAYQNQRSRDRYYGRSAYDARYGDRYGYDNRYRYQDRYDDRYDRRCSGTTGTIVGGAAGVLAGREVAGRGNRTIGSVIGGALGAVAGRAIDRSSCRN